MKNVTEILAEDQLFITNEIVCDADGEVLFEEVTCSSLPVLKLVTVEGENV